MTTKTVYDSSLSAVDHDALVAWAAQELKGDATLLDYLTRGTDLGDDEVIHQHQFDDDVGEKGVIVRTMTQAGGTSSSLLGVERIRLQAMAVAGPDVMNRRKLFRTVLEQVGSTFAGKRPDMSGHTIEQAIRRDRMQKSPRWGEEIQRWYQTHTYLIYISPE